MFATYTRYCNYCRGIMPHPNPNSQKALNEATKKRRRPGRDRKVKITEEKERQMRQKGNGSLTDGINKSLDDLDKLFAILPVFAQAKIVIEMSLEYLPKDKVAIAEAVLLKLEDLEIESLYKECEIEGSLPEPKSGAWII